MMGHDGAVELLISTYQDAVEEQLRGWARRRGLRCPERLEDAAQGLWLSLMESGGHLLEAYDAERGSLENYLTALTCVFLRRDFRATRRRLRHERAAGRERATHRADTPDHLDLELAELLSRLTPAEAAYWHDGLVEPHPDDAPLHESAATARQLKHRILLKTRAYLE